MTDSVALLPGVDSDTKELNGSVRYYGEWKAIRAATDSTEERSAVLSIYESFDFDEDGKINMQVTYGDFGGAFSHLSKE